MSILTSTMLVQHEIDSDDDSMHGERLGSISPLGAGMLSRGDGGCEIVNYIDSGDILFGDDSCGGEGGHGGGGHGGGAHVGGAHGGGGHVGGAHGGGVEVRGLNSPDLVQHAPVQRLCFHNTSCYGGDGCASGDGGCGGDGAGGVGGAGGGAMQHDLPLYNDDPHVGASSMGHQVFPAPLSHFD